MWSLFRPRHLRAVLGLRENYRDRSPLAPLCKGGTGVKVPLEKGDLGESPTTLFTLGYF